jgi:hypothetical protein
MSDLTIPTTARARFAALLAGHLLQGTRPGRLPSGEPWTDAEFGGNVRSTREVSGYASPRSVSNWRKGTYLPAEIEPILNALFGPGGGQAEARAALLDAFRAAWAEKRGAIPTQARKSKAHDTPVPTSPNDTVSVPEADGADLAAQVEALILAGYSPPQPWRPLIRKLNLNDKSFERLDLLHDLLNLQELLLNRANATDYSPPTNFTILQRLDLDDAVITNTAPLTSLVNLECLSLFRTQVDDLSALTGLRKLRALDLSGTKITNIAPLAGIGSLQELHPNETRVSDLTPLQGLTKLRILALAGSAVSDLNPLSTLTGIEDLSLQNTAIKDLSPLATLTRLEALNLRGARLPKVEIPLTLKNLGFLDLTYTNITDLSSLASFTKLRKIFVSDEDIDTRPIEHLFSNGLQMTLVIM